MTAREEGFVKMGRAGFEPAATGLKIRCSAD
jgi:hypothetical protein